MVRTVARFWCQGISLATVAGRRRVLTDSTASYRAIPLTLWMPCVCLSAWRSAPRNYIASSAQIDGWPKCSEGMSRVNG